MYVYIYIYIYTYYTIKLSGLGLASKTPIQTIFKNLTYGPGALSPTGRAQPTGSRPPGPHGAHHRAGAPGRRGRLRRPQGAPAGEGLAVARGAHKRTHTNARARPTLAHESNLLPCQPTSRTRRACYELRSESGGRAAKALQEPNRSRPEGWVARAGLGRRRALSRQTAASPFARCRDAKWSPARKLPSSV